MIPPNIITIENLRGMNTKKTRTQRAENEANLALNGYFDVAGSFIQRYGFLRINTTEIGSDPIDSIYQFGNEMITAGGVNLISYDLNSDTPTNLSAALNGSFFDFEEYIPYQTNYLILTNGEDAPFKYDGTDLTNLSITAPGTSPTATASAAGGTLTASATYKVAVTFLRDDGSGELQESNPCTTVSVTLGAGDNRIALTNVPVSADTQVTGRNVYISRPNGAILYKATTGTAATITDNVATTYNITANVDVLVNAELEYDHDPAPNAYIIEKYKTYTILAGDPDFTDRIYVSKDNQPWYFPQGDLDESTKTYFSIGEPVSSIKSYYDGVFIFGSNGGIYVLQGSDASNFSLSQVKNDQNVTAVSDRATVVQDNWCYFLNTDGYYRTNGQIIQKMSEPLSAFFNPADQEYVDYNVAGFSYGFNQLTPVAFYYKDKNQILIWITQSGQNDYDNNICFVLHLTNIIVEGDIITPNYSIYTGFQTRCTNRHQVNNQSKYFLTAQNDGFVMEPETGDFDGSAVNSAVTASGNTTLTDSTQTWTVNAFIGFWAYNAGQFRLIVSNTATELTVDPAWDNNPEVGSDFAIGLIDWEYEHAYTFYGNKTLSKRLIYVRPRFISTSGSEVEMTFGYDFTPAILDEKTISVSAGSLWDAALWDVAEWDGPTVKDTKVSAKASRIHRANTEKFKSIIAGQSIQYDGHDKIFQMKGVR